MVSHWNILRPYGLFMSWKYAYTPDIWSLFFTCLLLSAMAIYSGRRRNVPGAIPFMIGCLFAAAWAAASTRKGRYRFGDRYPSG